MNSHDGSRADIHAILRRYWGYDSFRPMQEEIIRTILRGEDCLGLLPTGGGKSITFQVPALATDGLTLVVTPLIALMRDQVDNLLRAGIRAVCLHSGLSYAEHRLGLDRCRLGKAKLLYVSPEKLQSKTFVEQLHHLDVRIIVVDEAHCISQWGYDFRPSYLRIAALRERFPDAPVLALTASATPEVVADIMRLLEFRAPKVLSRSFARPNISYIVREVSDKTHQLLHILRSTSGTAIVYVRSRSRTQEIASDIDRSGIPATYYHAGLDARIKEERQRQWRDGDVRVIVATNAFGMGIDKPDVRLVVHLDCPPSLEEYYQEAGRAGRDGEPSYAVLLAGPRDKARLTRMVDESFPPKDYIRRIYELAGNFLDVAVGEGYGRVFQFDFRKFTDTFGLQERPARSAMKILTQAGWIDYSDEVSTRTRVMMGMERHELYGLSLNSRTERVLDTILRGYPGLYADFVHIDESEIARRADLQEQDVLEALITLSRMHVLKYVPRTSTPYLLYVTAREEPRHVLIPREVYEDQRQRLQQRIEAVKRYAFDTSQECRANTMLRYFGETPDAPCQSCDICRARHRTHPGTESSEAIERLQAWFLEMLAGGSAIDLARLTAGMPRSKARMIADAARSLVADGKADLDSTGQLIPIIQ